MKIEVGVSAEVSSDFEDAVKDVKKLEKNVEDSNKELDKTKKKVKLISDEIRLLAQEYKKMGNVTVGKALQVFSGDVRKVENKKNVENKEKNIKNRLSSMDSSTHTDFSEGFKKALTEVKESTLDEEFNALISKAKELGNTDMAKGIREVQQEACKADGMKELKEQIEKVREALKKTGADTSIIDKFEKKIEETTKETSQLVTKLNKVSQVAQTINSIIPNFVKTALSLQSLKTILNTVVGGFNKIIDVTEQSSAYIENLHMFEVSMGKDPTKDLLDEANKYYKRGIEFQNQLHEAFSTNMSDTLKYQGLFNQMAKSMSIPAEQAYLLSENFTKLGYDLSSLYNLDPSDAMQKLRAGLAGQTKPLRDIGLDITQQTLAPKLKELGIDRSVKQLTQAEKMVLRYIVVLEQAEASHKDFAKTIDQPANQLKILKEQIKELTQAFGNMFLPILKKVLPYINGFVMTLKEVFNFLAELFGYTEDMQQGMSSLNSEEIDLGYGDELEEAKKLKSFTLGFDELNVLKEDTDDSSASGIGGAVDQRLLDAMKEYDNMMSSVADKAKEIRNAMLEWLGFDITYDKDGNILDINGLEEGYTWLEKIRDIALFLVGVKITFGVLGFLANLGTMLEGLGKLKKLVEPLINGIKSGLSKIKAFLVAHKAQIVAIGKFLLKIAGIIMAIIGILDYFKTIFTVIRTGNMSLQDFGNIVKAILVVVAGIALAFGAIPALIAGLIGAVGLLFTTVVTYWRELTTNFKVWFTHAKAKFSDGLTDAMGLFKKFGGSIKIAFEHVTQDISTFFANNFGGAIKKVAEFLDTIINTMIEPLNKIIEFFGGTGFGGVDFTSKVEAWIEENKGDYKTDEDKQADYTEMFADVDKEMQNLKDTMADFYQQEERDIYAEYLASMTQEEIAEREKTAQELRDFKASVSTSLDELKGMLSASNVEMPETTEVTEAELETSQNTLDMKNEFESFTKQFNLDSEESLEVSEEISDEISFTNALTNQTNTELGSIFNFLKTELMTKLQGIKEACENIRIKVENNYYYGGEGYATGGMPSSASLFYAHENGMPELVGRLGSNTAVMNNQQIVDAVASGVADAVARVMGNKKTVIQIDGKEILSATEKARETRGYGIVGGAFAKG